MKRTAAWLGAVFLAALAVITAAKLGSSAREQGNNEVNAAERARIAGFWTIYGRATALRTRGEWEAAAQAYREGLRLNSNHEDSLYYLGTCLYQLGEYAEAEQEFRSLIALNPQSGRGYGQLGRVLSVAAPGAPRDVEGARQAFERELQIYSEQAGPLLELGGLELNQGELREAEREFRAATRLGSAEAEFLLGYTLYLQGRRAEAERSFETVLAKYRADAKLTSKGVLSEGDVAPAAGKPLTALQRAALKSMLLLKWNNSWPARAAEAAMKAGPGSGAGHGRAAWADFAGDGHPGLAVGGANLVLYRWKDGRYVDVTRAAGVGGIRDVWEPYWADLTGGGHPDLYLARPGLSGSGQNLLLRNEGDGRFREVTAAMGLGGRRWTARACFGEFSGSGRMDLVEVGGAGGGSSVRLFRNAGKRFVEATAASGLASRATAVDCAVADYDGDGRPDLFVQFWRGPARLFRNLGEGRFADVTERAGLGGLGAKGYSSIFFDYDRDGRPDLLVTSQAPLEQAARWFLQPTDANDCGTVRLFHNQGGKFREVTSAAGLRGCYSTMQAVAADFDGDGWPDLLLAGGGPDAQQLGPSVLLRNLRGKRFVPWAELPAPGVPAEYVGAAAGPAGDGGREVYLSSGPASGMDSGGWMRISAGGRAVSAGAAPQQSARGSW